MDKHGDKKEAILGFLVFTLFSLFVILIFLLEYRQYLYDNSVDQKVLRFAISQASSKNAVQPIVGRKFDKVNNEGPWIVYKYTIPTSNIYDKKEDLITYANESRANMKQVKAYLSKTLMKTHKDICSNKTLRSKIIDINGGVRIEYYIEGKKMINVKVIPYTCELMDKVANHELL